MKASNPLIFPLMVGALLLQGCATTGGSTKPATAQASVPVQTAATSAAVSRSTIAAIPEANGKPIVRADTKDSFEVVAAAIRQEMQPGGRFAFVNSAGRQTVETGLTDMGALFDQYGSVNKMDPKAQGRLLADQNSINEVLARYDANRRICWQETPVGTHFPRTVCRTLGEIQNQRNHARQDMDQAQKILQQQNQIKYTPAPSGGIH